MTLINIGQLEESIHDNTSYIKKGTNSNPRAIKALNVFNKYDL